VASGRVRVLLVDVGEVLDQWGLANNGPMAARQVVNRSVSRKFCSCASTASHSTSNTKRDGDSIPRVIRTERQPGVATSTWRTD
jgi:hypothetical protein